VAVAIGTVAEIIRTHGAERAGAVAIEFEGQTITYGDLHRRSSQVANGLRAAGVGPQDRVAFIDKNGPAYFEALFGAAKVNAVTVGVNWRLAPAEMAFIVNDSRAKVVVVGPDFVPHIEKIEPDLATVATILVRGPHARYTSYETWRDAQAGDDPGEASAADDVALQLYTSGTTGLPKGAMITNDNFFGLLEQIGGPWRFGPDSVNLCVMPMFHIAGSGWSLVGMFHGCRSVVLRDVDPGLILELIPRHQVTNALFAPAVIQFLLATPGVDTTDYSSLHTVVYGASPITDTVLATALRTFGCDFVQVYGLTETTGAIVQLDAADHDRERRPDLLRSCGKPYPWVELRIVDTEGRDCAPGAVGELWVRTRQNMKGYWNQPEETAKTITPDGWLRTGDAGYVDADGYVFLHDRVKDMIVSGAENVYPAEVENALMRHPDIADVAVIGVPHERWGETVKAVVVLREGATLSEQEIIAFARQHLGTFKCPTSVDFAGTLPRNPSGKLLKRELREPYWADRERRIG
jgi:long-chain acyl-CoA synthetase